MANFSTDLFQSALRPDVRTVNGHLYTANVIEKIVNMLNEDHGGFPCAARFEDFAKRFNDDGVEESFLPRTHTIAHTRSARIEDGVLNIRVDWVLGWPKRQSPIIHPYTHRISGFWNASVTDEAYAAEHGVPVGKVYDINRIAGFTFVLKV